MTKHVTLPLSALQVRMEYHSHVAIEFQRGTKWSEFVYFEAEGPRKGRMLTSSFEREYYRPAAVPIDRAALSFLRAYHRAYSPDQGLFEIIMEIYIMSKTNENPKGLHSLPTAELLKVYNELAEAVSRPPLKSFKQSKGALVEKIEALQADAAKLTPEQQTAKAASAVKAEKRLAGLAAMKAGKAEAPTKPTPPKAFSSPKAKAEAAKPAAPAAKDANRPTTRAVASSGAVPAARPKLAPPGKLQRTPIQRGTKAQGIGAFCKEQIRKGLDNDAVLKAVKAKFPTANTSLSSIAWYRNKLKNEG